MIDSSSVRDPVEELAEEFLSALRRGEGVTIDGFVVENPESADHIRRLFPTLLMLEGLREGEQYAERQREPWTANSGNDVRRFGDFFITREIGRGGMGIVYAALQQSLGRRVALKVMAPGIVNTAGETSRFQSEARAAAQLHHTNIVPVFGVGEQNGIHYYVMQYIEGAGLDELLRGTCNSQDAQSLQGNWMRIAQLGTQLASALQYAHEHDILHRDIKPANLLLDSNGIVWISDFGLAKTISQGEVPSPGKAAGTLRYMPPEQLNGAADERSDVYSLGLTLYELTTWQPAFNERVHCKLVKDITGGACLPPRKLNPAIPADLESIVLKAIKRQPDARYQTAKELADDLRRFSDGLPVGARRISLGGKLWRWSRRNPAVAALSSLTLVLCFVMTVVSCIALSRESQLRYEAVAAQDRAVVEQKRAADNLTLALTSFDEIAHDLAFGKQPSTISFNMLLNSESHSPSALSHDAATVLQKLAVFYQAFAEKNSDHAPLKRQLFAAHRHLGHIHRQLGRFKDAETAYRRTLELYCGRNRRDGGFSNGEVLKASVCIDLGSLLVAVGRCAEAREAYFDAYAKLTNDLQSLHNSPEARYEMAQVHKQLAELAHMEGQIDQWGQQNQQAIAILEDLLAESPSHPEYRFSLACAYGSRPPFVRHVNGQSQSFTDHTQAIAMLKLLTQEYPNVAKYKYELSKIYARVHLWKPRPWRKDEMSSSELVAAERRLRKALAISRELVQKYPSVPNYAEALGRNLLSMGVVKERHGDVQQAEQFFRRALSRLETLARRFESVPAYCDSLADAKHVLGRLLCGQRRFIDAEALLQESVDCRIEFLRVVAGHRRSREVLADQYHDLSMAANGLGDEARAAGLAKHSIALRVSLWPNNNSTALVGPR